MIDYKIHHGDCLETLRGMADNSVDSIVTDPPYGLSKQPDMAEVLRHWLNGDDYVHTGGGFMGKSWDSFVPGPSVWREALRVLKPGGYALVFAGSRTQDLMSVALRLAGFEIRDIARNWYDDHEPQTPEEAKAAAQEGGGAAWIFGSGFPKSLDVSKAIDKAAGAEREITREGATKAPEYSGKFDQSASSKRERRDVPVTDEAKQWEGWGTALKPAYEPIIIARKPLDGTIADNMLTHGVGAINVDGCRVPTVDNTARTNGKTTVWAANGGMDSEQGGGHADGRWPANILHDGCFEDEPWGRYFYCAKASKADRNEGCEHLEHVAAGEVTGGRAEGSDGLNSPRAGAGRTSGAKNHHPTVKPTELMQWCCRLVTPPGGTVLDMFAGSGSTGKAALAEGFNVILCEREAEYLPIIDARCAWALFKRVTEL